MADSLPYYGLAQQYGNAEGVDPKLVESVIENESGGQPHATSNVGARGLMQIMPSTGAGLAQQEGISNPNLYDPQTNVRLGVHYLAQLLHQFHGNRDEAIAGYNAGGGAVEHYHGIPPYKETQNYVQNVEATLRRLGATAVGETTKAATNWSASWNKPAPAGMPHQLSDTLNEFGEVTDSFFVSLMEAVKGKLPWEKLGW